MRCSTISAIMALVSSVVGQTYFDAIQTPAQDEVLTAGKAYDLVWVPDGVTGTATIQLLEGASNISLQLGPIIAQSIDNTLGTFSWTPSDRGHATYGWRITLDSDATKTDDSNHFAISGSSSVASDSTSTSSSSSVAGVTVTKQISTNPSYTSTASTTSTTSSTSSSSLSTLATITSTSSNATITPAANKQETDNATSTSVLITSTLAPTTTAAAKTSSSAASSSSSSASSAVATTSSSAALANKVGGGIFAVGGLVLALAL